jgi:uncharacterized protein YtpQ (UPF0354 family)
VESPITKDDFAKLLADRIQQAGEKGGIVYEPEEFRLRGEGERAATIFLTNAYKEYCSADEGLRERVIKHWVRNWFGMSKDMPEDFEDVKPDLLPALRSRSNFDINSLREEVEHGTPGSWPYQVLGEHFGIGLVYDLPDSMRLIPQASLDAWGVTFYEALEAARENLVVLPAKFIGPQSGEGAYLSATCDGYDASRLLLTDIIRQFQVKGDPIAMIPNRENLIVVGSEDDEGLSGMLRMAAEALKQPRPISGIALRLDGDEWVPWLPDVSHPLYKDFQQHQLQTLGQNYAEQKDLLDKLNARNGDDVFVATFIAIPAPDGRVLSWAVWPAGVNHTLLPKTDVVMLGRIDGEPRMVEWQRVMDVAGDLLAPLDVYPFRYRVREFPSEEQLAAMGNMLG